MNWYITGGMPRGHRLDKEARNTYDFVYLSNGQRRHAQLGILSLVVFAQS
jgi:hypothetical protein